MTTKNTLSSQKDWLAKAKKSLAAHVPGVTWDDFARLAFIEPRAMKSYRMPETSADYRSMPKPVEASIAEMLKNFEQGSGIVARMRH